MDYSKALKIIRSAKGLTQKELAEKARVNMSFISLLECGRRAPSLKTLESFSKVFDVPMHLMMLLASEEEDLKGIGENNAQQLGRQLLDLVVFSNKKSKKYDKTSSVVKKA